MISRFQFSNYSFVNSLIYSHTPSLNDLNVPYSFKSPSEALEIVMIRFSCEGRGGRGSDSVGGGGGCCYLACELLGPDDGVDRFGEVVCLWDDDVGVEVGTTGVLELVFDLLCDLKQGGEDVLSFLGEYFLHFWS